MAANQVAFSSSFYPASKDYQKFKIYSFYVKEVISLQ